MVPERSDLSRQCVLDFFGRVTFLCNMCRRYQWRSWSRLGPCNNFRDD